MTTTDTTLQLPQRVPGATIEQSTNPYIAPLLPTPARRPAVHADRATVGWMGGRISHLAVINPEPIMITMDRTISLVTIHVSRRVDLNRWAESLHADQVVELDAPGLGLTASVTVAGYWGWEIVVQYINVHGSAAVITEEVTAP